ncbi:hypothetical protein HYH03_014224 [Edaphochlamys debaryana]|uniref:Jacalin-type lectin domain-containing protein n=1 Tax=Edaphochlamys debaryana TaxID=47281 RepID=A0A835XNG0_9CHLO|nr:hypothetical protein HYH03_014224 [Edaphochlamys debaryana]|eukprot:KAG2487111.1 hypothetical protein HYH03_014224 [Edaphochlamys debaryana]
MDSIQITYGTQPGPQHGGAGGGPNSPVILAADERILGVAVGWGYRSYYYNNDYVFGMQFTTSNGTTYTVGNYNGASYKPDATPCAPSATSAPYLQYITGLAGGDTTQSGNYLNQISFVWALADGSSWTTTVTP